jgi:hypothetical protein
MTTTPRKQSTAGERKTAFAALYRVVKTLLSRGRTMDSLSSVEFQQGVDQTNEALDVLARIIHGAPKRWQYAHLCDVCYLRYAEHFAREAGKELSTWCCTPCYQQLEAEGKLKEATHE